VPNKKYSPRWVRTLTNINKFIALYNTTEETYNKMKAHLESCITEYLFMVEYKELCKESGGVFTHKDVESFKQRVKDITQTNNSSLVQYEK
jgi:hypothetical protein